MKAWLIVMKKELVNTFRDTKSLAFSILIPLLLFPIMFYFIGFAMNSSQSQVENQFTIAIQGNANSPLAQSVIASLKAKVVDGDIKENVSSGKALVGIVIPDDFDSIIAQGKTANLQIYYDDSSMNSMSAQAALSQAINDYSKNIVSDRLTAQGLDPSIISPITTQVLSAAKESNSGGMGKWLMGIMVPLLLVLYAATSPITSATDMAAGEKERGTLEPLLTTKASRMSLLWGKYFTIIIISVATVIASLVGIFISFRMNGSFLNMASNGSVGFSMPIGNILLIGLFSLATTMTFGAIELSLSIYARSYKEAQTYLTPASLIAMVPALATYMLDAKSLSTSLFFVPIVNISCIIKELVNGLVNMQHIGITLGFCVVYVLAAILWARHMFNDEKVLFRS
ncbi:MAG: ABC transporter permease [Oscillospiraceae bacterium]|nr:ABC transporter permease [Oscillospiraceae bacterium]